MAQAPEKSEGAFRTIREVADWLAVPTHVLRFWESKFPEVAPVKGAGGRRYYRPEDMRLLGGIKVMLHDQGLTIRGVGQRIEDEGVQSLMAMSPDLDAGEATPPRARRVIRSGDEEDAPRASVGTSRPIPDENEPRNIATHSSIREEGAASNLASVESDADPMPSQPDADPMPDQPNDTEAAPQPGDGPVHDAPAPPQPVDRRPAITRNEPAMDGPARKAVTAPTEPVVTGPSEDEEIDIVDPFDEEIGQLGDPSDDDTVDDDTLDEDLNDDGSDDEGFADDEAEGEDGVDGRDDARDGLPDEASVTPNGFFGLIETSSKPLDPIARRRLRRVIRKLRDMIEDVEQELSGDLGR